MSELNRKEPRFQAHIDSLYRLQGSQEWSDCYIYDISDSGALLRVNQSLWVGDSIDIILDRDNRSNILTAKVANLSGRSVGIKFTGNVNSEAIKETVKSAFYNSHKRKKGTY